MARTTIGRAAPIDGADQRPHPVAQPGVAAAAATIEIRAIGNSGCQQAKAQPGEHCAGEPLPAGQEQHAQHEEQDSRRLGVRADDRVVGELGEEGERHPGREGAENRAGQLQVHR